MNNGESPHRKKRKKVAEKFGEQKKLPTFTTTNKHNPLKPQTMEILANIPAPIFGLGFGAILAALAFITSRKAA